MRSAWPVTHLGNGRLILSAINILAMFSGSGAQRYRLGGPAVCARCWCFECRLGEHDVGERCLEDLDDLRAAALVDLDPAGVADAELLPPPVHHQVEQVRVIAAGQMRA